MRMKRPAKLIEPADNLAHHPDGREREDGATGHGAGRVLAQHQGGGRRALDEWHALKVHAVTGVGEDGGVYGARCERFLAIGSLFRAVGGSAVQALLMRTLGAGSLQQLSVVSSPAGLFWSQSTPWVWQLSPAAATCGPSRWRLPPAALALANLVDLALTPVGAAPPRG